MSNIKLIKLERNNNEINKIYKLNNNFILVNERANVYFGGNQDWFDVKEQRIRGSAPVVAANITAYFAKHWRCKELYDYSIFEFTKGDFKKHMNNLWKEITPSKFGIWNRDIFIKGIKKYANKKNINLVSRSSTIHKMSSNYDFDDFCEHIIQGFKINSPIALLIGFQVPSKNYNEEDINMELSLFKYNWVTVTEYFTWNDEKFIKVFSKGKIYLLNLNALKSRRAWMSAIYFKIR